MESAAVGQKENMLYQAEKSPRFLAVSQKRIRAVSGCRGE